MDSFDKKTKNKVLRMLFLIPIIPAIIFYKHFGLKIALITILIFWILGVISFISTSFANNLHRISKKVFSKIGHILSIIALVFVYIFAVLPTGFLMKIVKRDRLGLIKENKKTYWKNVENEEPNYEFQF